MAPVEDDTTYADETVDDTYASTNYGNSTVTSGKKENPILKKCFVSCESDALGSVHRAWAVTVLFMVLFFIVAIIEGEFCWLVWCVAKLWCAVFVVHEMCALMSLHLFSFANRKYQNNAHTSFFSQLTLYITIIKINSQPNQRRRRSIQRPLHSLLLVRLPPPNIRHPGHLCPKAILDGFCRGVLFGSGGGDIAAEFVHVCGVY